MRKLFSILAAVMLSSIGLWAETENGYAYVDLGMKDSEGKSIMWATMNIGATNESTLASWYGDYFAWGETTTKSDYSWSTYFDTDDGGESFKKYYNEMGGQAQLTADDDAARQKWGGNWRIPTPDDMIWLRGNCNWNWQTDYKDISGLNGYVVSNKSDASKFIFLPAAGYYDGTRSYGDSNYGFYWSSSLPYTDDSESADHLNFRNDFISVYSYNRFYGFPIRPVCTPTSGPATDLEKNTLLFEGKNGLGAKYIINGQFVIIRDGKTYNVIGAIR